MDNEPKLEIDKWGTKTWWLNGKLHRVDGPAWEDKNGTKFWYRHGKSHREDGPADDYADGYNRWYFNDKYYSEFDDWLEANTFISEEEKLMLKLQYG
jgi:hypothetical protein